MNKYTEVRSDYNDGNFTCIDAWQTDDPNEEGQVVAIVHESGDVYYIDKCAMYDEKVASEVKEVLKSIKNH